MEWASAYTAWRSGTAAGPRISACCSDPMHSIGALTDPGIGGAASPCFIRTPGYRMARVPRGSRPWIRICFCLSRDWAWSWALRFRWIPPRMRRSCRSGFSREPSEWRWEAGAPFSRR
jgi:hypothetical protein